MTILCTSLDATETQAALPPPVAVLSSLADAENLLIHTPAEQLVVVGPDIAIEVVGAFAAAIARAHPEVAVIAIRDTVTLPEVQYLMRSGTSDVVTAGDLRELTDACHRALDRLSSVAPVTAELTQPGQTITVFSPKGGAGKTTLSTNLSVALNDRGRNRVCLVDLDLAFGDVAISLQLEPRLTIVDAVGMVDPTPEDVRSILTQYSRKLDCLLAPVAPSDIERIPAALITTLLATLTHMYDFVIVDTPSQLSEHVMAALDASRHCVLITTPELPSLKNLRVTLDVFDTLGTAPAGRAVVLNRADDQVGLGLAAVQRVLGCPVSARIPSSPDVPRSINKGVPIVAGSPDHPVSAAIRRLAMEQFAPGLTPMIKHRGLAVPGRFLRRRIA